MLAVRSFKRRSTALLHIPHPTLTRPNVSDFFRLRVRNHLHLDIAMKPPTIPATSSTFLPARARSALPSLQLHPHFFRHELEAPYHPCNFIHISSGTSSKSWPATKFARNKPRVSRFSSSQLSIAAGRSEDPLAPTP